LRAHAGPALYAHEAGADGLARALESILSDPQVAAWSEEAEAFAQAVGLEAFETRLDALWDSVGGEDG
jgi:pantoate kinase